MVVMIYYKNLSFDEAAIVTVRTNYLVLIFGVWLKGKGVCRMKISDLSEKSWQLWQRKNWKIVLYLIIMMVNNTPEIKSPQKSTMIKIKEKGKIIIAIIKKVEKKKLNSILKITKKS